MNKNPCYSSVHYLFSLLLFIGKNRLCFYLFSCFILFWYLIGFYCSFVFLLFYKLDHVRFFVGVLNHRFLYTCKKLHTQMEQWTRALWRFWVGRSSHWATLLRPRVSLNFCYNFVFLAPPYEYIFFGSSQ